MKKALKKLLARIRKKKAKKSKRTKLPLTPTTYKRLVKAIEGSAGKVKLIAYRLQVSTTAIYRILENAPDYVQEAMRQEKETVMDIAEDTNIEMMQQRLHFPTALKAAHFTLTNHPKADKKGYKVKKELTLQGGDKPLKIENKNIISLKKLKSLPLKMRKKMLAEIEEEEKEDV